LTNHLIRDFYIGFIRVHILFHTLMSPTYGVELMRELNRHGYKLGPGTLYPILHGLEKSGLIEHYEKCENGHIRKYYTITELGKKAFNKIREKANELMQEINEV